MALARCRGGAARRHLRRFEARWGPVVLALDALSRVWPEVRDAVGEHEVWTPDRLQGELGLSGGHLWHGEIALDQLYSLRPGLDLSAQRTPIPGLYLGSGGTHPVGGHAAIPGWLAAGAVLEDA